MELPKISIEKIKKIDEMEKLWATQQMQKYEVKQKESLEKLEGQRAKVLAVCQRYGGPYTEIDDIISKLRVLPDTARKTFLRNQIRFERLWHFDFNCNRVSLYKVNVQTEDQMQSALQSILRILLKGIMHTVKGTHD